MSHVNGVVGAPLFAFGNAVGRDCTFPKSINPSSRIIISLGQVGGQAVIVAWEKPYQGINSHHVRKHYERID